MKNQMFFLVFLLVSGHAWGQSLETSHVGSSGQLLTGSSGSIHMNVGEVCILQSEQIKAGVIQFIDFSTIVEKPEVLADIKIFPNPTSGPVTIEVNASDLIETFILVDANGRVIEKWNNASTTTYKDLSGLVPGEYYILPIQNSQPIGSFSIILL